MDPDSIMEPVEVLQEKLQVYLSGANLSGTYLNGACLSRADLPKKVKIVSVSGVGSAQRLTNYRVDTDEVWCGCFKGTLTEFENQIKTTHIKHPEFLNDYLAVVAGIG